MGDETSGEVPGGTPADPGSGPEADRGSSPGGDSGGPSGGEGPRRSIRALRARYQRGLLVLLRGGAGDGARSGLVAMAAALEELERTAVEGSLARLWWVASALVDALADGALQPDPGVRRLLASLDTLMRRLEQDGRLDSAAPSPLLQALVECVRDSRSEAPRVVAVRQAAALAGMLVPPAEAQSVPAPAPSPEGSSAQAPSSSDAVPVDAIRDLLVRLNETLDRLSRTGVPEPGADPAEAPEGPAVAGSALTPPAMPAAGTGPAAPALDDAVFATLAGAAGELALGQSAVQRSMEAMRSRLLELDGTIADLRDGMRRLELDAEPGRPRHPGVAGDADGGGVGAGGGCGPGGPGRRYRQVLEDTGDLTRIREALERVTRDTGSALDEQSRAHARLQQAVVRGPDPSAPPALSAPPAIRQVLLVEADSETWALPMDGVEAVTRIAGGPGPERTCTHAGVEYRIARLGDLLAAPAAGTAAGPAGAGGPVPLVLLRAGDGEAPREPVALQVDDLDGHRAVAARSPGGQLAEIPLVDGATILGDGRVVLILDVEVLAAMAARTSRLPGEIPGAAVRSGTGAG